METNLLKMVNNNLNLDIIEQKRYRKCFKLFKLR